MIRSLFALAVASLLGATGCERGEEEEIVAYCSHVCPCVTGLPSSQRRCTEECIADIDIDPPPGCVSCLVGLTCGELLSNDDRCDPFCGDDDISLELP